LGEAEVEEVGSVTHYFTRIGVAVVELSDALSVGDRILIKGMTTNIEQTVSSMEIEQESIKKAEVQNPLNFQSISSISAVHNFLKEMRSTYVGFCDFTTSLLTRLGGTLPSKNAIRFSATISDILDRVSKLALEM